MTSKEYFRQAYRLDQRINLNIAELDELRAMACNITSSALSEKVARSRDGNAPFVKAIERITKLEQEIDAEVDTFVNLKTEMRGVIESVEDRNEQLILHYRYILNYTWEKIAELLGTSARTIHRWHDSALRNAVIPKSPTKI